MKEVRKLGLIIISVGILFFFGTGLIKSFEDGGITTVITIFIGSLICVGLYKLFDKFMS